MQQVVNRRRWVMKGQCRGNTLPRSCRSCGLVGRRRLPKSWPGDHGTEPTNRRAWPRRPFLQLRCGPAGLQLRSQRACQLLAVALPDRLIARYCVLTPLHRPVFKPRAAFQGGTPRRSRACRAGCRAAALHRRGRERLDAMAAAHLAVAGAVHGHVAAAAARQGAAVAGLACKKHGRRGWEAVSKAGARGGVRDGAGASGRH
jgi:hypothetical protein